MDFKGYSAEDFVLNKRFRQWILDPQKNDHLFWEDYIRRHPEKLSAIIEAKKLLLQMPEATEKLSETEKNDLWEHISFVLGEDNEADKDKVYPINAHSVIGKASLKRNIYTRVDYTKRALIAATVLIFLTISWSMFRIIFDRSSHGLQNQEELVRKENPWGQKSTVFLSDGTEVVLNSGSSLAFAKAFNGDVRKVYLEGEAFFNVAKDPLKPFIVISREISTTALGTSFNVRAYPHENKKTVSLMTGKVKVSRTDSAAASTDVILQPGEEAYFNGIENKMSVGSFNQQEVTSWKEGIIHFRDAGAREVFDYLEKWYGVTIREANQPVKKWNYTGEFNNMDLHNVLSSIGYSMNFEFTKEEKLVTIKYIKTMK